MQLDEWCCPKPDMVFGIHKVLKHYYLQGLHQVVVNADFYMNGQKYNKLSDIEKNALKLQKRCIFNEIFSLQDQSKWRSS